MLRVIGLDGHGRTGKNSLELLAQPLQKTGRAPLPELLAGLFQLRFFLHQHPSPGKCSSGIGRLLNSLLELAPGHRQVIEHAQSILNRLDGGIDVGAENRWKCAGKEFQVVTEFLAADPKPVQSCLIRMVTGDGRKEVLDQRLEALPGPISKARAGRFARFLVPRTHAWRSLSMRRAKR